MKGKGHAVLKLRGGRNITSLALNLDLFRDSLWWSHASVLLFIFKFAASLIILRRVRLQARNPMTGLLHPSSSNGEQLPFAFARKSNPAKQGMYSVNPEVKGWMART